MWSEGITLLIVENKENNLRKKQKLLQTHEHLSVGEELYIFCDKYFTPKGLYQVGNNSYEHLSVYYPKDTNK